MWVIDFWGGNPPDLVADFVLDGEFVLIEGNVPESTRLVDSRSGTTVVDLGHLDLWDLMYPVGVGGTLVGIGPSNGIYGIELATGSVRFSRVE
jgi:hypothetical protein